MVYSLLGSVSSSKIIFGEVALRTTSISYSAKVCETIVSFSILRSFYAPVNFDKAICLLKISALYEKIGSFVHQWVLNFSFRKPFLGELSTDFGLLYNYKLKYEDSKKCKSRLCKYSRFSLP